MCVRVAWDLYLSFHKEIFLFFFLWFSAVLRGAGQILEESDSDICSDVGTVLADQNDLGKDDSES